MKSTVTLNAAYSKAVAYTANAGKSFHVPLARATATKRKLQTHFADIIRLAKRRVANLSSG